MELWAKVVRDFRRTWPQLLAADLLAKMVTFAILSPLVGLALRFLLAGSGNVAVKDEDILFFFLRPLGMVTLLIVGGGSLAVGFLLLSALTTIGYAAGRDRLVNYVDAVRFVFRRLPVLFLFAVRVLILVLLTAAPFLAAVGIVYLELLGKSDINYYLTEKPPVFWVALALGGTIAAILLVLLARLVVSWVLALPLLLFENRSPVQALSESRSLTKGRRMQIALQIGAWLAGWLALSSATTALLVAAGRLLVPAGTDALIYVAVVVSVLILTAGAVNVIVSFFAGSFLGLLIARFYADCSRQAATDTGFPVASEPLGDRAALRLPKKSLLLGSLAAFSLAVLLTVVLLRSVDVEDAVEITAHRGYSAVGPENTIAAIERAISAGADWVEIDVQETADGEVVLFHDGDLKKVAGLDWKIEATPYSKLREVDIGSWFAPEFADQRIATLADVLDLCKDRIGVNIELKHYGNAKRLEEAVIETVAARGMQSDVAMMSLKTESVEKLKSLDPGCPVGLLAATSIGNLTRLDVDFLAVNRSLATGSFIRTAHRKGKAVHVWTVNDPIAMSAMISRGVDNIITDEPALARSVLVQRAALSPVERLLVRVGAALNVLPTPDEPSPDGDA